jgi:hypothetical protein
MGTVSRLFLRDCLDALPLTIRSSFGDGLRQTRGGNRNGGEQKDS